MARQKLALFKKRKKKKKKIFNHKNSNLCFFGRNVITTFPSYYIHNKMLSKESSCRWPGRHYYQGGATHHAQWARICFKVQKKIRENTWISRLFLVIINFKGNKNLRHISFRWFLVKMSIDFLLFFCCCPFY